MHAYVTLPQAFPLITDICASFFLCVLCRALLSWAGVAPESEGEGGGLRQGRLEGVRRRQRHPRPSPVDGKPARPRPPQGARAGVYPCRLSLTLAALG